MDTINGYFTLAEKLYKDEGFDKAYNFGPDLIKNLTVLDVINEIKKYIPQLEYEIKINPNAFYESKLVMLDNSLAKHELNWTPKLSSTESIKLTAEWYNAYLSGKNDLKELTKNQLKYFFNI